MQGAQSHYTSNLTLPRQASEGLVNLQGFPELKYKPYEVRTQFVSNNAPDVFHPFMDPPQDQEEI